MKLSVPLTFALLLAPLAWTQDPAASSGAKIEFEKTEHDFGEINKGDDVTVEFAFKNSGKVPLEIKNISTSCGCTSAKPDKTEYAAGESGRIPVTFSSSRFNGKVTKKVTVHTNDPGDPRTVLTIHAEVVTDVISDPANLFISDARPGVITQSEIMVFTERLARLDLKNLKASPDFLTVDMERVDDRKIKLILTIDGAKFPPGQSRPRGHISYETNSETQKEVHTSLTVNVLAPIKVSPNFVLFWASKAGKKREMNLEILATNDHPFHISDLKSDLDFLGLELTLDEEKNKTLLVTLKKNAPEGQFKGQITLKTDVADQPEVILPVRGSVIK